MVMKKQTDGAPTTPTTLAEAVFDKPSDLKDRF